MIRLRLLMGIALASVLATSPLGMSAQSAQQQKASPDKIVYRGVVIDDNDEPLIGVYVIVKGTKNATATDAKGEFNLPADGRNNTLVFTYVGMETQELVGLADKKMTVRMKEDNSNLEAAVVNGISRRDKESFTGSAATYTAEQLKELGPMNILAQLSALDASFIVTDNNLMGSDPNQIMDININGKTTINLLNDAYSSTANQPLFILDGFETTLAVISDMSMDRIESITILKDAASTAIYGAKAANGVVVVETRKPQPGKLRFSYQGNYGVAWADLSDYNLMNASEKLQFEKLSGHYGELDANGEILGDSQRSLYYSRYKRVVAGLNSYWMSEPLRTAFINEHSLNGEGGDSAFRYGMTFRYKNQQGVMKDSDRENIDGTINLSYRVARFNLSNQTNVSYTQADREKVAFSKFSRMNPYMPKYDEYGEINKVISEYYDSSAWAQQYVYNPLWDFNQKSFNTSNNLMLRNNLMLEVRPIDELRLQARLGLTIDKSEVEAFVSPFATQFINTESMKRGSFNRTSGTASSLDGSLLASYGKVIGVHTINAVAGIQLRQSDSVSDAYNAIGYISDMFSNPNFSNGYPEGSRPSSTIDRQRSASYYLNANYAYDMRYLFDINVRNDGASVFGVNNPFNTTWSAGFGWNIHNEKWFEKTETLNYLKVRYSYGNPGNQNIQAKIANNIYLLYTAYPNMFGLAATVNRWGNNDLKWERTSMHNVGMDLEMFKSRLRLTIDYQNRVTDPMLLSVSYPPSTGSSSTPMNIGATKNYSISSNIIYQVIRTKNFRWQLSGNVAHTKSTYFKIGDLLEKYNEEGRGNQTLRRYYDGASFTSLWAMKSAGIDPMTGNEVFIKKDGTYTFKWDANEEVECGDSNPIALGNIGTSLRYKGWSCNVNFQYRVGGQAFRQTLFTKVESLGEADIQYNQDRRALYDRWQQPGDVAKFKRIDDTSKTNMSSRFIDDENTLKCSTISVGYENTEARWLSLLGLSSLTVRMYMNDIFYLSTIKEERGLDYPFQRSVSASLSLRF
ncbi:MAG: SusC/RagA family TonB-linked outer membrane protein [Bacteroidales bacterium]|nr:SusC/RagA family TonB-linked outer membrane protein [Bacteroidales bacterium]